MGPNGRWDTNVNAVRPASSLPTRSARNKGYWKTHYVVRSDPNEIERHITSQTFSSQGGQFELVSFRKDSKLPSILISPGSGGHSYVFAELGFEMYRRGFNVFIMPKHGGQTVSQLMTRHHDALDYVLGIANDRVGLYAEGLGGYVAFYLALAHGQFKSLVCQNAPAILNDREYHEALLRDAGPWVGAVRRRRILLPAAKMIVRVLPGLKIPIRCYLDWKALVDRNRGAYDIERRLVEDGYLRDPEFDRWYPLSHVMSLVSTPPPSRVADLRVPTMFVVATGGPTPAYVRALYDRLPLIKKRFVEVRGSVYWMLSHPVEAADASCGWFDETL